MPFEQRERLMPAGAGAGTDLLELRPISNGVERRVARQRGAFPGVLVLVQDGTVVPAGYTFVGFFFQEIREPSPSRGRSDSDGGPSTRMRINAYRKN